MARAVRADLVVLADDGHVHVRDRPPRGAHARHREGEHLERVAVAVGRVGVREELADVADPGGPEHRVRDGVCGHVAVGVGVDADVLRDPHPAHHQRLAARREAVRVVADADPRYAQAAGARAAAAMTE
jgi:hypothetical protein